MLRYAERDERKRANPLELAPGLACPYLGLFGEEDGLIPLADEAFEMRRYPGAGHAFFFNHTRTDAYRPDAAADA
jgi:dienelactone hydrolase